MANETDFDHDRVGHILADRLLQVPSFQRAFSWTPENVQEYLDDLSKARDKDTDYFVGTTVFASGGTSNDRLQVVDGQQRLATTAILLIAIRDLLEEYGQINLAKKLEERYIRGFVLSEERDVERIILSPDDQEDYDSLLDRGASTLRRESRLKQCYDTCLAHLRTVAPNAAEYKKLMDVESQLDNRVQVLVATATSLSEAYVIFETLNDRGAALTTADLLKNYLFSQAGSNMRYFESKWVQIENTFDSPDDLVKFIRHEFVSRNGKTALRKLYRAIQDDLRKPGNSAKKYITELTHAVERYAAIRDPEHQLWASTEVDVRDALLAFRRFGFERSLPLLLALLANLSNKNAAKLLVKVINWTIRAQIAGRLDGSVAEDTFATAAMEVSAKRAKTQPQVKRLLQKIVPTDSVFKEEFINYGRVSTSRAKYLLAMLESALRQRQGINVGPLDWTTTAINSEHIEPRSRGQNSESAIELESLGNMTLLEKKLNRDLGDKNFAEKRLVYGNSAIQLTLELSNQTEWTENEVRERMEMLAELACTAWPAS